MQTLNVHQERMKEVQKINSCIPWLKYCSAECCRMTMFRMKTKINLKRGTVLVLGLSKPLAEGMKKYYALHNIAVIDNSLHIYVEDYTWRGLWLIIKNKCKWSEENGRCAYYEDRPKICRELEKDTCHQKRFFVTSQCRFRYWRDSLKCHNC